MRTLSFLAALLIAVATQAQTAVIHTSADRSDAIYHAGDTITFSVTAEENGQPAVGAELTCVIERNGEAPTEPVTFTTTDEPRTFQTTATTPGFVRCVVKWPGRKDARNRDVTLTTGAAVDPLLIKQGQPEPADFDAFWAKKTAELDALPLSVTMTPVTNDAPAGLELFDVEVDCTGPMPVRGYYVRPVGAEQGKHPALLSLHGAGVRSSRTGDIIHFAEHGYIALDINAHGILNGQPDSFYSDLSKGELADYRTRGMTDRETFYFLGMFQRVYRGLQFLKSQPEWDGKVLVTYGSSQGGGQALVGGGLDPAVTLVVANIPALCDHGGELVGRRSGWPKALSAIAQQIKAGTASEGDDEKVKVATSYFDGANFAKRIKGRVVIATGFEDTTCAPESVYAAYNNVPGEKRIINNLHAAHTLTDEARQAYDEAVLSYTEAAATAP